MIAEVTMVSSLIKSLPLIVVILTVGVDGQRNWGVNYSPSYVCALKGSSVTISCTVKYPHGYRLENIFWTKTTVPVGESPDLCSDPEKRGRVQCVSKDKDTSSLTLTAVTEADKHVYYCRFTTDRESGRWTGIPGVQLDVTDLQVETHQSVKEGDPVTLRCKSSCSLPERTTFIWFRNTHRFTDRTVNQLQLRSVRRSDAGDYQCAVRGNEHLVSPPVYLNVEYPPKSVSVSVSPSVIVEGDSVTLSCISDSNPPAHTYSWYKGGTFLGSGDTYRITNIESEASGNYYCSARNKHGSQSSAAVNVNVMYPPKSVSVSISPSVTVEGDSVTLSCISDSNPPALNFSWFKEDQTSAVGSGQSFSISNFSSSFSGRFYCEAQNKYGSQRSASVSLSVKGVQRAALHTVSGLVVGCGGLIFIIIIIIVFIKRKKRRGGGTEDVNQKQTADASDDTYTALDPASRTSADIYSTIPCVQSRAPDDTYTALELQSRSSEYETLAVTSADPH